MTNTNHPHEATILNSILSDKAHAISFRPSSGRVGDTVNVSALGVFNGRLQRMAFKCEIRRNCNGYALCRAVNGWKKNAACICLYPENIILGIGFNLIREHD